MFGDPRDVVLKAGDFLADATRELTMTPQDHTHLRHEVAAIAAEHPGEIGAAVNPVTGALSNVFLFLLIFGMSATVDVDSLVRQLKNTYAIGMGCLMQFGIMPFLGYVVCVSLQKHGLNGPMGITLLIVLASPGGSFSNLWVSVFNADLSLSVAMTTISTVLSCFFLPFNLSLYAHAAYGQQGDLLNGIDFTAIFVSLGIVVGGIFLGLLCSWKIKSPKLAKVANALGSVSGIGLIIFSILLSGSGGEAESHALWSQDWSFYVGVALPCILGMFLANVVAILAKLKRPECMTLSIECCYQNAGIATSAAVNLFPNPAIKAQALAVPLFYGMVQATVVTLYCIICHYANWSKAPKTDTLCAAMTKTYEIDGPSKNGIKDDTKVVDMDALAAKKDDDSARSSIAESAKLV
mmetsp:Transcript_235/g.624  ORF Transcript_235/g.624 Transcript_235/m.624 type:complete len:408 (+) Transcript_235:3-1226(+)|eukprot:CAMPEP_0181057948 /NCGR_PEP_ID=MMETSP1070-20121207/20533_1 /TAXON_ID=265543 /ORGANISM="Minutocellus polymorphus, Strain NH13" /LENGTH=407 /DNA_ID=CAMNT_0023137417 /DNA_START=180 /DNA_END=1403 /DNA_ORIENTATION=-